MQSEDADPLEDIPVGETVEVPAETEIYAHDIGYPHYLGSDRDLGAVRLTEAQIEELDNGDVQVVIEVAADVTKVDPKEKPYFMSGDEYNSRSRSSTSSDSSWPTWAKVAVQTIPTAATFALTAWFSTRIINAADMTVNGTAVSAPPWFPVFLVMMVIVAMIMCIQYLPRPSGGVRR